MRFALIADIHSNIYGLQAVLGDIKKRGVDYTICMGDLVGYCAFPNEVIDLVRGENILTVMGNYDDAVGFERMVCGCDYQNPKDIENAGISLNWTIDATYGSNKEFLRGLPGEIVMKFWNKTIVFVHGSPGKINEYLNENSVEAKEVMENFAGDILVCGHTHKPYYKAYGSKMLVNCGSAGKPKTGKPDVNYAIMDVSSDGVKVNIIEVTYDFEKAAQAIEDNGLPVEFAEIIRTGKVK